MKNTLLPITLALACISIPAQQDTAPLFQAIRTNDLAGLAAQLAKGADVNSRDARGNTLLIDAAAIGSKEAVKLLLDRGADLNAKNEFEATALLRAANDPEKARMLVEKGADVNAASKIGRTPLIIAASCDGCASTVKLLLEKGAEINASDQAGDSALNVAAQAGVSDTVSLLVEKGAKPDVADRGGFTPLMGTALNCDAKSARLLLSKDANVNAANTFAGEVKFGKIQLIHLTSLMLASPYCDAPFVKLLLDAGAKIDERDIRGMTALMMAVGSEKQDQAVLKVLLAAHPDVNAKSTMGETALDWAAKFGNRETTAALKSAGATEGVPYAAPTRKAAPQRSAAEAATAGLKILQTSTTEFFRQSGCGPACHAQPFSTMAFAAGRANGVSGDEAAAKEHTKMMTAAWTPAQERLRQMTGPGGIPDGIWYSLRALETSGEKPTPVTDAMAFYIARSQRQNGGWDQGGTSRAPISESNIARAALAVRSLRAYCPPAMKLECDARIARAQQWIAKSVPLTNDDFAMRLDGLYRSGAPAESVKAAAKALLAVQRADGGWAQNKNLQSDAFATGESLWVLQTTGALPVSDAAYQRGVKYLLGTQWEDGSWYVRSRAPKFQPYFQSGFPYDHDQWISAAATGYATMALVAAAK